MNSQFGIVVLISGRGTNLGALIEAATSGLFKIAGVVSNRPEAVGLHCASRAGLNTDVIDHRAFAGRAEFESQLADVIHALNPDLVVLAGFMRILTPGFVGQFSGRLINLHPSILPLYPGLDTHKRAIAAGDEIHGSTVHYVDATLDGGPVLIQTLIPIAADDSPSALAQRLLPREHKLLAKAVELIATGRVELTSAGIQFDGQTLEAPLRLTEGDEVVRSK